MYIDVIFHVVRRQGNRISFGPALADAAFLEVFAYAREHRLTTSQPHPKSYSFLISCSPQDEGLPGLYELLAREDWKPRYGYVPIGSTGWFPVRLVRRYAPEDYDAAPLFYSMGFQHLFYSGEVDRLNGQGWTAKSVDLEDYDDGPTEARIGGIGAYTYFVRADLKEALLAAGLVGLEFRPLRWSTPEPPADDYWEILCAKTMPTCLVPVIWNHDQWRYEEDGYEPVELQFKKAEVDKLGEFDAAWTKEELGSPEKLDWGTRILVFSPRFRQTLRQLDVREDVMVVGLVRLVE